MSHYTTEVRFICEQFSGLEESKGYNNVEQIIASARPKVFDFDYPIFDSSYKSVIETKILKHYYTREIGMETVGLWKLKLNTKLNEIMPYYNKLYESALINFNPMWDTDLTTTHEGEDVGSKTGSTVFDGNRDTSLTENVDRTRDYDETNVNNGGFETDTTHSGTDSQTVEGTDSKTHTGNEDTVYNENKQNEHQDNEWNLFSDTPQGGVTGIENAYDGVADNAYLTDARNIKTNGSYEDDISGSKNVDNAYTENGTVNTDSSGTNAYTDNVENSHNDRDVKNGSETDNVDRTQSANEKTDNTEDRSENYTNTREWSERVFGKRGGLSYSKLLQEFRETFLNIDMMVIDELKDLFFLLW